MWVIYMSQRVRARGGGGGVSGNIKKEFAIAAHVGSYMEWT